MSVKDSRTIADIRLLTQLIERIGFALCQYKRSVDPALANSAVAFIQAARECAFDLLSGRDGDQRFLSLCRTLQMRTEYFRVNLQVSSFEEYTEQLKGRGLDLIRMAADAAAKAGLLTEVWERN